MLTSVHFFIRREKDILMEKKGDIFLNNLKKCIQMTHSSLWNSLPKDKFGIRIVLARGTHTYSHTNNESNYCSLPAFGILPQKHLVFDTFKEKTVDSLGFRFGGGRKFLC